MTAAAWGALGAAGALALADWFAVATDRRRLEYVLKPAALVALVVVAVVLDAHDDAVRRWFVVALAFSLAGDVFLMLPRDRFAAGLAAFLLAHVAYTVGLNLDGGGAGALAVGAVTVATVALPLGRRIFSAVRSGRHPRLAGPVAAYVVVISTMVVSALATGDAVAAAGAVLFYASDGLIGWSRFVGPVPGGRTAVMVSYHLGQAGLVLSLA